MESINKKENNRDKIEKEKVLDMLRVNGFEHSETKRLTIEYIKQQEGLVSNNENTSRATIVFNIERSDLYIAVGDIDGALDCLEDARLQAHQENETELYDQIMKKMDDIEDGEILIL